MTGRTQVREPKRIDPYYSFVILWKMKFKSVPGTALEIETWAKDTNFDNVSQYPATIPTCQPQMGSRLKPAGQHQCWSCLHVAHRSEALVPRGCWQCHAPWGGWLWGKGSDIRQYHEKGLRQNSSTWAHWHFAPGDSWWWRVALCTAGSSSPASTH